MNSFESTGPAENYAYIGEVTISTSVEISEKVAQAQLAKQEWKELGVRGRISLLRPVTEEFRESAHDLAYLISTEVGKPLVEAYEEVLGYTEQIEEFFGQGEVALEDNTTSLENQPFNHRIVYEPRGATAVIAPWNFPYGMAMWGIMPNLIAGNTVVFKTSEECPLSGKFIEEVFARHNLPDGVFGEVYGNGDVGQQLVEENVDFVWFTGSSRTGRKINETAAGKFIPTHLEMGGSNPCVVFEDADIETTAQRILNERFYNGGQVCNSIKRVIVEQSIQKILTERLAVGVKALRIGHPLEPDAQLGSLAARRQTELLRNQVNSSLGSGARVVSGVKVPADLKGAYHPAVLLDNITSDMRVWQEEVFGPVLPVMSFRSEAQAVELANNTAYGLGALIVSSDIERAERVAGKLDTGAVNINGGNHFDNIWNPIGGNKHSGNSRQHGTEGMRALCNMKVIAR